jgi:hypothetical protein
VFNVVKHFSVEVMEVNAERSDFHNNFLMMTRTNENAMMWTDVSNVNGPAHTPVALMVEKFINVSSQIEEKIPPDDKMYFSISHKWNSIAFYVQ